MGEIAILSKALQPADHLIEDEQKTEKKNYSLFPVIYHACVSQRLFYSSTYKSFSDSVSIPSVIILSWLCLKNYTFFINSKINKAQIDTLQCISTMTMIYLPTYDSEQQGLETVLHTAHDSPSTGFIQKLQFTEASGKLAYMSFCLTLQTTDETNGLA